VHFTRHQNFLNFGNNVAGFSVIWWVDAADQEVKVVIIRPSD